MKEKQTKISEAKRKINVRAENKLILCIDGGGMRGILSIQLLKCLEKITGMPAYNLFDMVAGTSTGAIIAALISTGKIAEQIEEYYDNMAADVFSPLFMGNRFFNPPRFTKKSFRRFAAEIFRDMTLKEAAHMHHTDLLITAKDMAAGEETFFTAFRLDDEKTNGTYANVLLRSALEASMSAPTYFAPLERFVDGGTTTYNNPSSAAIIEALNYSGNPDYQYGKVTVISLGTGISPQFIDPAQSKNPKGPDIAFWLNWLMTEMGQDASDMQTDLLRSPRFRDLVDYRRFQISFDTAAIKKLPDFTFTEPLYGCGSLHEITDKTLYDMDMADLKYYNLVKIIGMQMAQYIENSNRFTADLVVKDKVRDELVTARGDVSSIVRLMSSHQWLQNQPLD
jgi:hypothetical protein